jgi:hypothetical protein
MKKVNGFGVTMTAYVMAQINIHDRSRYAEYEAGFMAVFAQYEGTMLSVDEAPEVLEGTVAVYQNGIDRISIASTRERLVHERAISRIGQASSCRC